MTMRTILATMFALIAAPIWAATITVPATPGALQAAIGKAVAGDVLLLADGEHGAIDLSAPNFAAKVTIRAEHAGKAHADSILVRSGSNLFIAGLAVWPSNPQAHGSSHVTASAATSRITFSSLDVRGGQDAANWPAWSKDEWLRRAAHGVWLEGPNSVVQYSRFTGVRFGITILGPDSRASWNEVNGFAGDGIRGQGQRGVYRGNLIQNCVSIDENHADGFQAHTTPDRPISGIVLDRNRFLEWTLGPHALRCGLQGIGMFDGWYDNLTITNNIVAVSNGHGIMVMGARKASIWHNTAVTANGLPAKWPWIDVHPLKNGSPSVDVILANNVGMDIGQPKPGVTVIGNSRISDPRTFFADMRTYVPTQASGFIGAADPAYSTPKDTYGKTRVGAPDRGAVEAQ